MHLHTYRIYIDQNSSVHIHSCLFSWADRVRLLACTEPPTQGKVVLHTSFGDVDIELWPKEAGCLWFSYFLCLL